MIRQFILVCSALLIITASCGQKDTGTFITGTYTIETIDGVKHIRNHAPLWGDEPKVALEFIQKIGAFEATEENYIMYNIWDVGRDHQGNIYILDSGDCRIQKFDSHGEYIETIGRRGEGPGEFRSPVNFNLDSEGRMYVGDAGKYHFIILDNEGKEIKRFRKEPIVPRCRLLPNNRLVMGGFYFGSGNKEDYERDLKAGYYSLFHVFDDGGNIVNSFGEMDILVDDGAVLIHADAPFDIDKSGNIYIAYRYRNRIEKRDPDGNILFAFDRPLNFEETNYRFDFFKIDVYSNTISMSIAIDNKERIWVITFIKQPEEWVEEWEIEKRLLVRKSIAVFEIFNRDGILLGSIPLPEDIFLMRIFDDRLFIVDTDRVSVSEYKIVEK